MIAEVKNHLGKHYLSVAGINVVVEGQQCFDCKFPEKYWTMENLVIVADAINSEGDTAMYELKESLHQAQMAHREAQAQLRGQA